MNLSTAVQCYLDAITGELAPTTITWYRSHLATLTALYGPQEITSLTITDLRSWRSVQLNQKSRYQDHPTRPPTAGRLAVATQRSRIRAVKRFFAWLTEEHLLNHNAALRLNLPRKEHRPPKHNTDADLQLLLEATASNPRDYALILFLAETGARVQGVSRLNIDDLDLAAATATVNEKYGKSRQVYLTPRTITALRSWLALRPAATTPAVFTSRRRTRLTPNGIYQVLQRTAQRTGSEGRCNPHSFRHAYARSLIANGATLETVSKLMGHSSIKTTAEFYAVWNGKELQDRHTKYSRIAHLDE